MNSAHERAIRFIYEKYSEPLSLADIANSAIVSRFHFCRTFKDAIGVTPGRYLSAIRIYQAKRMLLNTRMNVTDIAFAVGYNSLGSFSNHFTDSVGLAPGRFRRIPQRGGIELPRPGRASSVSACDGNRHYRISAGLFRRAGVPGYFRYAHRAATACRCRHHRATSHGFALLISADGSAPRYMVPPCGSSSGRHGPRAVDPQDAARRRGRPGDDRRRHGHLRRDRAAHQTTDGLADSPRPARS